MGARSDRVGVAKSGRFAIAVGERMAALPHCLEPLGCLIAARGFLRFCLSCCLGWASRGGEGGRCAGLLLRCAWLGCGASRDGGGWASGVSISSRVPESPWRKRRRTPNTSPPARSAPLNAPRRPKTKPSLALPPPRSAPTNHLAQKDWRIGNDKESGRQNGQHPCQLPPPLLDSAPQISIWPTPSPLGTSARSRGRVPTAPTKKKLCTQSSQTEAARSPSARAT